MSDTRSPPKRSRSSPNDDYVPTTTEVPCGAAFELAGKKRQHTSVVKLIVKLEQLAKVGVSVSRRIHLLREVDTKIGQVEARRASKDGGADKQAEPPKGLSIEHRIYCLMVTNLKLALVGLDQSLKARARASATDRPWLIRRLFKYFAKSIELSMTADRPWVPGVWCELHELYYYLISRQDAGIDETRELPDETFDPEREYKRLLLVGLVRQINKMADRMPELMARLPDWAEQTRLKDPRIHEGTFDVYLVEIPKDVPARKCPDVVQATSSAWILEPAPGFLNYVSGLWDRWGVGVG